VTPASHIAEKLLVRLKTMIIIKKNIHIVATYLTKGTAVIRTQSDLRLRLQPDFLSKGTRSTQQKSTEMILRKRLIRKIRNQEDAELRR
jgi:hypothetical protein